MIKATARVRDARGTDGPCSGSVTDRPAIGIPCAALAVAPHERIAGPVGRIVLCASTAVRSTRPVCGVASSSLVDAGPLANRTATLRALPPIGRVIEPGVAVHASNRPRLSVKRRMAGPDVGFLLVARERLNGPAASRLRAPRQRCHGTAGPASVEGFSLGGHRNLLLSGRAGSPVHYPNIETYVPVSTVSFVTESQTGRGDGRAGKVCARQHRGGRMIRRPSAGSSVANRGMRWRTTYPVQGVVHAPNLHSNDIYAQAKIPHGVTAIIQPAFNYGEPSENGALRRFVTSDHPHPDDLGVAPCSG